MDTIPSAEMDALRKENVALRRQLSAYEGTNGRSLPKQASIADVLHASLVFESITEAILGLDDDCCFAYLNREAERLLGRNRKDLIGKKLWAEFPEFSGSALDREYRRARSERVSVHLEEFYAPLNAWFEVKAYPLSDGLAVFFQNVTERKRAERELQRREAEFRTIVDSVPVIVAAVGPDGRFRRLNRKFGETFGKAPEWAIGRTIPEGAGEPHITIARPYVERAMNGEASAFESVIRNHANELRDVSVFYIPQRTPEGQLDGFIAMLEDVTEEKRSEAALRESENRFRSLFEVAAIGMALFNVQDRRALRVNDRFAEILGYTSAEMIGMSFAGFTVPQELPEVAARLENLIAGVASSYQVERRYLRKDGSITWCQSSVSVIRNSTGVAVEVLLVVEDITLRKLNEAALRESENRFRLMAESLPQLVWTCQPDGACDYLSSQWVQYTGLPEQGQLGLRWLDLVLHPDDRDRTYAAWMAAVRDEAPYDLEYRIKRHDGQYRWFKTRGTRIRDTQGQIVRWFGTCTDIHDRREAEDERRVLLLREQQARALAELLNSVGPMLLTELEPQVLIQKVTDLATRLTGAQFGAFFQNVPGGEGGNSTAYKLSGASQDAFAAFPAPWNRELFAPAFAGPGVVLSPDITQDPCFQTEPQVGSSKGAPPIRSYLAVPVISRAGDVTGGLFFGHSDPNAFHERHAHLVQGVAAQAAIALDNARLFTEVQRSEQALRTSNVELRQANADLEQFAYAAAHDLQEPLRMVTSYTQLLDRSLAGKLDERNRTFMNFIVGGATRMSLLLQDLLAYTETSRALQPGERVSLHHALQLVLRNLQPSIEDAGAKIVEGKLPCVLGRESQFVQLFQNLISNAIKYRQPDLPPEIEIDSERQGDHWIIRVRDNGIGIDPAYHQQVFGVFKRLHGSDIPGTGIGLAICQRVVERAGGQIWVESESGRGATFTVRLPVMSEVGADRGT